MADKPIKEKRERTVRQKKALKDGREKRRLEQISGGLGNLGATAIAPVLDSRSDGLLPAMQWVVRHGPEEDRTWEQKSARQWKDTSPGAFYSRMVALEEAEVPKSDVTSHLAAWDPEGKERCPTCRRFPGVADPDDPITPEMSDDEVDEGIEKEFVKLTAFMRGVGDAG